jgi:hypothetical protein
MVGIHVRHVDIIFDRPPFGDLSAQIGCDRRQIHCLVHQNVGALDDFRDGGKRRDVARKRDRALFEIEPITAVPTTDRGEMPA